MIDNKFRILVLILLAVILVPAALAVTNLLALQGNVENNGLPITTGNITVSIWSAPSGGSLVYDSSHDYDNAISNGRFDIMLGEGTQELVLEYGKMYYMAMEVNGQSLSFNGSARRQFQSGIGLINWSYLDSLPSYVRDYSGDIAAKLTATDQRYNETSLVSGKLDATDQRYNETSLISGKLDVNDQRYNETARIDAINGTVNIQSLGFNTTVQLDSRYYLATNPNAYISSSASVLSNFYNKSDTDSRYLQLTDQRFNDTSLVSGKLDASDQRFNDSGRIDSLNNTKMNLSDQRYNDTSLVSGVNSSSNFKSLGFNLTSELNTLYYTLSNPSGFIASTVSVLSNFYNKSDTDSRYLQLTDQRFNDTSLVSGKLDASDQRFNDSGRIDSLNNTKMNLSDQRYNDTSLVSGKLDASDQRFNDSGRIDSLNNTKMNLSDQRYNDTSLVSGVNSSSNFKSLGFNLTSELNTLYYTLSNPSGFIASTVSVLSNFYNKSDTDSRYLQLTDQRFNDTSLVSGKLDASDQRFNDSGRIDSLNNTKMNLSDQRYNDTSLVSGVNSSSNFKSLGFNLTSELNTLYYNSSNPRGFLNSSGVVSAVGNWSFDKSSYATVTGLDYVNSTAQAKVSPGDCAPGMIVQNVTASGVECITDQTGNPAGSWSVWDEFSRKYYNREAMFESVTSGYNEPWIGTAIAAGTTGLAVTTSSEHPGVANLSTSTTASSGYSYQITGASTYLLGSDYVTKVTFMPITKTGNVTNIKFGFMDVFTVAWPVDGVYFNITQINMTVFNVTGQARSNSLQSNTSTTFTLNNNTWYAAIVYINSPTMATFYIYNETNLLWSDSVTSYIPTAVGRQTSNAFVAYTNGGTTAQTIAYLDYIAVGVNRTLIR